MITGSQIRSARAIVRWSVEELAKAANVGVMTVRRAEAVDGLTAMLPNNAAAIRAALEAAGVEFTNGGQPGVRMKCVDVAQRPDGTWGVKSIWEEGAPAETVTPNAARDIAVAAQGR